MEKTKITLGSENGDIDGIYSNAGEHTPLVIIVNGHNGFYTYGMFPFIQQSLFEHAVSSYSFNYSHGGIKGDDDYFTELEKYEANCMRLETADLVQVLENTREGGLAGHSKVILLAHSLGGVPAIFGSEAAATAALKIDGLILLSTVKTLMFWPADMVKEWAANGVYFKKNNRTKQELPQGFEFLQEVLGSQNKWNVKDGIQDLHIPILIVHGENDEAIPLEHGQSLYQWREGLLPPASLRTIPGATHTFNTKHPFEGPSAQLLQMLDIVTEWIECLA